MFKTLFGRKSTNADHQLLYGAVVARARAPQLYRDFGVPDTLDGRFEMMALHAYFVLRRLKKAGEECVTYSQKFFDVFVDDISVGLREAGVGDQVLPKRLQKMSRVFYGRAKAWDSCFTAKSTERELSDAFQRNLYPDNPKANDMSLLARYAVAEEARIDKMDIQHVVSGQDVFPAGLPEFNFPKVAS